MGNNQTTEEVHNTSTSTPSSKSAQPKTKGNKRYQHKNQMASERKFTTLGQGQVRLTVIKGDLTTEKVDIVVCTANKNLDLTKGRASSILLEVGGNCLQEECKQIYPEGIEHGEIAVVTGGNLSCKNVYFVALPFWSGNQTDRKKLYDLIRSCYEEASGNGSRSLALPALGTGYLKYPADVVAQTTFSALEDFSNDNPSSSLQNVSIIVYYKDISAFQAFEQEAILRSGASEKKFTKKFNFTKKKSSQSGSIGINSIMSGKSLIRGNSIGEIRINICHGKLATFRADVIVNSTTNNLKLDNGGLSQSLLEAAGNQLQEECNELYPNGVNPGEIAVTSGYGLKCTKVIHGSLPKWDKDKSYNSKKTLKRFVTNCLNQIEEDGFRKVAFPALGTGSLNYPADVSAQTMIECLLQHERNHPDTNLMDISIVIFDEMDDWQSILRVFEDELHELKTKADQSVEAGNGFQFKLMENLLRNALERGAENNSERGTREWFRTMFKSDPRPPKYWSTFHGNKSLKDWIMDSDDNKPVVVKVNQETFTAVSNLVQNTWESKYVGQGRDAQGLGILKYSKVRVIKVERIENCKIFEKYAQKRQELFSKASKEGAFPVLEKLNNSSGPIKTLLPVHSGGLMVDIFPEINECFMFHGTKESVVDIIVQQGLDSRLSGVAAMFGQGVYCAESSTKADQYADEKTHRTDGWKKMFLTRTCLGKMCVVSKPQSFARAPCCNCLQDKCGCLEDSFFDSVVGDGSWNFREFVVYDRTQVYPEYIITYVRE